MSEIVIIKNFYLQANFYIELLNYLFNIKNWQRLLVNIIIYNICDSYTYLHCTARYKFDKSEGAVVNQLWQMNKHKNTTDIHFCYLKKCRTKPYHHKIVCGFYSSFFFSLPIICNNIVHPFHTY